MLIKTLIFWALLLMTGLIFVVIASSHFRFEWKRLSHKIFCSVMIVGLWLFITAALYWHWGSWPELQQYWQTHENRVEVDQIMAEYQRDPQQLIRWFNQLLAQHPADSRGWYYLGKLYMAQKQYEDAIDAYQQALHLKADEPVYQGAYAEAVFFSRDRHLDKKSRQLLATLLEKAPDNPLALNLMAMDAWQRQQYHQAVKYWQRLAAQLPPDSEDARKLYEMIARAQQFNISD